MRNKGSRHLRVNPVPDSRTAFDQIAGWIDDYNGNHPHPGLRIRSPREFRGAHQSAEVSGQTGATPGGGNGHKAPWLMAAGIGRVGAAEGTRTPDPIITNDVLYQLSYCGARSP